MRRELLLLFLVGAAAYDPRYTITQPVSLSAPAGGSVTLPCAFTYPREIDPLQDLRVYWRRGGFHGEFIYNHTEGFTRPDYGGRIALVGDPEGNRTASIRIDRLRESDASEYICHIRVQKNDSKWEQWRGVPGTHLTVTAAAQDAGYQMNQPVSLSAPAGGSVTLPCAFTYPREIEPLRDVWVYWGRGEFYGEFIYNHTEGFTRPDYGGRIALVGDPRGSRTASIRIDQLRVSDASEYVCHVRVQNNDGKWFQWRGNPGTKLTVTEREAPSPTDSTRHPEMVTTGTGGAGRTCLWHIDTVHLVLIGLVLVLSKAVVSVMVFALGRQRGWDHGPERVTGRVSGSDAPSASGFELTSLAQSSPPGIPGNDTVQQQ